MNTEFKKNSFFAGGKAVYYAVALLVGGAVGIINPLVTAHMTVKNTGNVWIGIVSSSYFIFLSVGAVIINNKMKGRDVRNIIVAGLCIAALCTFLFPFVHNTVVWLLLMCFTGIGISFNMVGIQAALHSSSPDDSRSAVSGMYSLLFASGFVISSVTGSLIYARLAWAAFAAGGIYLIAAVALIRLGLKEVHTIPAGAGEKVFSKIFTALCGSFAYGFSETTLVSLYPLFLLKQGYSVDAMGYALGIFVIGCITGIVPVTRMSDRMGRSRCLFIIILASFAAIFGIVMLDNFILRMAFSFIAGFALGPVYPLSLAMSVQDLPHSEISSGTAMFTFSYGIGSAAGPFLSSLLMNALGNNHIFTLSFVLFAAFLVLMALTRGLKQGVRSAQEKEEDSEFSDFYINSPQGGIENEK
ncbi:putative MFS family arabinose efflux permease [Anaerobacterium chartisolvens]|uniref:Putative MFS family arabinose efflux permease n=1 Tax=Anaerobacterium chartisolvens TaxID=1297424 RepID=A0A369AMT2_9FIRM|nr:MFS transporter [Anaerobacterium chartisolvens]RCX09586.1 putative MFS family arabinose efflux permease [Anaerobacterium chartisolvens]